MNMESWDGNYFNYNKNGRPGMPQLFDEDSIKRLSHEETVAIFEKKWS